MRESEVVMPQFGVLGSGVVAKVLSKGLKQHGYDVRIGSRDPQKLASFRDETGISTGTFADVAASADVIVLAVKGTVAVDALRLAGADHLKGKVVIDTTNPIADLPPVDGVVQYFTGPNESLMERLQREFAEARFVKAFNSVGNASMVNPQLAGGPPTMFYCGNDAEAKRVVAGVLEKFGWEPADMGTATAARAIEPLCQLWCIPGFRQQRWTHAFKLIDRE
jgi:8-hydroxy-5-deazaflavin:NADPH oxidoreductase